MKRGLTIVSITAIMAFISCSKERIKGEEPVITESRNVSGFTKVAVSGSTNVYVTRGANFKVDVKGYSNLLPYFETRLIGNTLQLGFKQNVNVKNDNTEVFITLPVLSGLKIDGSANILTTGVFNGATDFTASISGSGNIHFSSGSTERFSSTIAGSGNIYTLNMVAQNAETNITGSGNTEITATHSLKVKIAGSGNVYYLGTPAITTTISGSGAVIPK